jgi:hypothetical protein
MAYFSLVSLKYSIEKVYKTPIEMMGVKKTILLLKIVKIPMSAALSVFTKKGKAANDITLHNEPVIVYNPTCLEESLRKNDFIFSSKILTIDFYRCGVADNSK